MGEAGGTAVLRGDRSAQTAPAAETLRTGAPAPPPGHPG